MCQCDYAASVDRFQPVCLALNGHGELFLIGRTYDQRYSQVVHDAERHGLSEITDLDVQVHEAEDMY